MLIFFASMICWIVDSVKSGKWDGMFVFEFFINVVMIVVVVILEGLFFVIIFGLAFVMRKMMAD